MDGPNCEQAVLCHCTFAMEAAAAFSARVHWKDSREERRRRVIACSRAEDEEAGLRRIRRIIGSLDRLQRRDIVSLLRMCGDAGALVEGRHVHAHIVERSKHGQQDIFLENLLVEMYGKCGRTGDARAVFDKIVSRNVFSWTMMISAYANSEQEDEALELFYRMDVKPDKFVYTIVVCACSSLADLAEGKRIHAQIVANELEKDVVVESALLNMYGKCGSLQDAVSVFEKMEVKDAVPWSSIITAYAQCGHSQQSLQIFRQMDLEGVKPTPVTFASVCDACANLGALEQAKVINARIVAAGFDSNAIIGNSRIDMFGKCGSPEDAMDVFAHVYEKNVVSWTALIAAYVQSSLPKQHSLKIFQSMDLEGVKPNHVTFINILDNLVDLEQGKAFHERISNSEFRSDLFVETALINMFGKCRSLENARRVFDKMEKRDVVSWNAMIAAYSQNGHGKEALELFKKMAEENVKPTAVTYVSVLDACARLSSLEQAKLIHGHITQNGFDSDVVVQIGLVNMYGKCSSVEDARAVFDGMKCTDKFCWTSLIAAYAQHGQASDADQLFQRMQLEGVEPDSITFINVASACGHAGLVDEGFRYLAVMTEDHGMSRGTEHYGCVIDLLGRAGLLKDAEELIYEMRIQPDAVVWKSLLGACKTHGNSEVGVRAAKRCLELDQTNTAPYILLSNITVARTGKEIRSEEAGCVV